MSDAGRRLRRGAASAVLALAIALAGATAGGSSRAAPAVAPAVAPTDAPDAAVTVAPDAARQSISVRDDLSRDIRLARPPRRIVSLCPPLTDTVCSLGECSRLVATDRFSDWPESVRSLPKAGGLDDPQIEEIVRLHPDLVLISSTQRITDRLRSFGIPALALDTESYGDIGHVISIVGTVLGLPERAVALNRQIEAEVHEIGRQAIAGRRGASPSVYYEVDGGPYAAGPASFIGELLTRLGARNIVAADLGPFPKLNPEYVVRHDPDVIFTAPADAPHLAERPGWDRIRAVRERRICSFPPEVHETIVHAGPRIVEGMRALAGCLARVWP